MINRNSVGGRRIYPTSSSIAEAAETAISVIGRFNDGMDQLNNERQLSNQQQIRVRNLAANSSMRQMYLHLQRVTGIVWQSALNRQRERNGEIGVHQNVLESTTERLFLCAEDWRQFKQQLDDQA